MAVTLGEKGALLLHEGGAVHVPAVPVAAVDPTGAGDAFTAALAVFWVGGLPLGESARRACAVAALTVTRAGTQAAFPTRGEAERLWSAGA